VEQRDELEIETRLRAALMARSELVTHSTLRPGVPPNEHTAGVRSKSAGLWSWRRLLVPVTVAAALGGGVFVGVQLPHDKGVDHAGSGGSAASSQSPQSAPSYGAAAPSSQAAANRTVESTVDTLRFTLADGWQVMAIDTTSACVTPKARVAATSTGAGTGAGTGTATLPCGVDAIYLKSDAAPDAWPLSTATKATGWWPQDVASASAIACPAAKPGTGNTGSAENTVRNSVALRTSAKYTLGAQTTAEYHEWAVTCTEGSGVRPMLWKLNPAGGVAAGSKSAVAAVVSADPAYDSALLSMVGTLHLAG
jgi:hypothetical protein